MKHLIFIILVLVCLSGCWFSYSEEHSQGERRCFGDYGCFTCDALNANASIWLNATHYICRKDDDGWWSWKEQAFISNHGN